MCQYNTINCWVLKRFTSCVGETIDEGPLLFPHSLRDSKIMNVFVYLHLN